MEKSEILKELKSTLVQVNAIRLILKGLIEDLEIEVKRDEEDSRWKGPGGYPDGCPASSIKDQDRD